MCREDGANITQENQARLERQGEELGQAGIHAFYVESVYIAGRAAKVCPP